MIDHLGLVLCGIFLFVVDASSERLCLGVRGRGPSRSRGGRTEMIIVVDGFALCVFRILGVVDAVDKSLRVGARRWGPPRTCSRRGLEMIAIFVSLVLRQVKFLNHNTGTFLSDHINPQPHRRRPRRTETEIRASSITDIEIALEVTACDGGADDLGFCHVQLVVAEDFHDAAVPWGGHVQEVDGGDDFAGRVQAVCCADTGAEELDAEFGAGIVVSVRRVILSEGLFLGYGERGSNLRVNGESNVSREEDFDEVGI